MHIIFFSKWPINILAYDDAQMVPIAQPFVYRWFVELNIKLFNVRMRAINVVITFVATVRFGWLLRDFFTAFILLVFKMLMYNDLTSSDTK